MTNELRNLLRQFFFCCFSFKEEQEEWIKCCQKNDLNRAEACLSLKVDVNTVSEDGQWSGLTIAASKNYTDLLEILLSHPKIKINQTTRRDRDPGIGVLISGHWTALMFACHAGNSAIVSRLVQEPRLDINYQDKDRYQ